MAITPWHCHDCDTTVATLSAARAHSKTAPTFRPDGTPMRHKLTQDAARAVLERADRDARWAR